MPTIHLTEGQARALLEHGLNGSAPPNLGGKARLALGRAVTKLKNAVDDVEYGEFKADLERLTEVLLDARTRRAVDAFHLRLRDLLSLATLWTGAEQLPGYPHAVLKLDRLDDPAWPAEVLELIERHGIDLELPGEALSGNEQDGEEVG